jgi:hypothetical protein
LLLLFTRGLTVERNMFEDTQETHNLCQVSDLRLLRVCAPYISI